MFPFREESIPVFEWAARTRPGDWQARYYLGLVYWGLRRQDEALKMLSECGNQPDYAPVYMCRAWLEQGASPDKALADFEKALSVDPKDWRNWHHLANYYTERGMHDRALKMAVEAARRFPDEDLIKILLARTYLNNGKYRECYAVLENATILPFEGQRDVHDLYVQCQICLALDAMKQGRHEEALKRLEGSKEYPVRLGTGRPGDPDFRVQDYLMMLAYEQMGSAGQAKEALERIGAYSARTSRAAVDRAIIERWYRTSFRDSGQLQALRELVSLVQGPRRRRE